MCTYIDLSDHSIRLYGYFYFSKKCAYHYRYILLEEISILYSNNTDIREKMIDP